jgi:nucleosome binding factor SPN SPT16 subunit
MIKNSSITLEKQITFLRINFHNPSSMAASKDVQIPLLVDQGMLFIKELTLKSENGKNLNVVHN